jgi:uncharacterized OsmC-like protein
LYLAVGGCVSDDLFREAAAGGIALTTVRVRVNVDAIAEIPNSIRRGTPVKLGKVRVL